MITGFLINGLYKLISGIVALFPNAPDLSSTVTTSIQGIFDYLSLLDILFPMNQILLVIAAIIARDVAIFSFKGLNWVINKLRGSG